ncbi:MAG: flagellin FliC [Magnetococcales bacterium]|nr:flagellin FliC [Magnetococcales bacterium]MBF0155656.1 flagellin FliC [Magnetococcales bacterium]
MALSVSTNVAAINAQRHLLSSTNALGTTFQRLSSGLRINSAKDDAAGLSISTRMTAQIRGTNQAVRNANDAISLVQVAEGALEETGTALQRIRELAVQASNDTLTSGDRNDLQKEVAQLMSEIQRISDNTQFNEKILLGGSTALGSGTSFNGNFHIGEDANQTLNVVISMANLGTLGLASYGSLATLNDVVTSGAKFNISAQVNAESAIAVIDAALNSVSEIRAGLGAVLNRLDSVINNLTNVSENTTAARSRILDADIAAETANLTKQSILQQAGTAILAQANQQPQIALRLLG